MTPAADHCFGTGSWLLHVPCEHWRSACLLLVQIGQVYGYGDLGLARSCLHTVPAPDRVWRLLLLLLLLQAVA